MLMSKQQIKLFVWILAFVWVLFSHASFAAAAPDNDLCQNARLITSVPFSDTGTNVGAANNLGSPGCGSGGGGEVFWKLSLSLPAGTTIHANTFGSNYDTVLSAWKGVCGSLSVVKCNDDTIDLLSAISFAVDGSSIYYLVVEGYDGYTGNIRLNVSTAGEGEGEWEWWELESIESEWEWESGPHEFEPAEEVGEGEGPVAEEAEEIEFEGEGPECINHWVPDENTQGLWYFNETGQIPQAKLGFLALANGYGMALDESAHNNDGYPQFGAQLGDCVLTLFGEGQYVIVPDDASLDADIDAAGALTVEAWINVANYPSEGNAAIVSKWSSSGPDKLDGGVFASVIPTDEPAYQLELSPTGKLLFRVTPYDTVFVESEETVPLDDWVYVAGQWRGGQFISVTVGEAEQVNPVTGGDSVADTFGPLVIGMGQTPLDGLPEDGFEGGESPPTLTALLFIPSFNGQIDELRISKAIRNNRAPVLDPIGDKQVNEDEQLQFTVTGSDPQGDALAFSASNLPTGASFDPDTQVFTWTPGFGDAGSYPNVLFTVTDDGTPPLSDSESITITVGDVNRPPGLAIR